MPVASTWERITLSQIPRSPWSWAIFHKRNFGRSAAVCNGREREIAALPGRGHAGGGRRNPQVCDFEPLDQVTMEIILKRRGEKATQTHPCHRAGNCSGRRARARDRVRARRLPWPAGWLALSSLLGRAAPPRPAPPPPSRPRAEPSRALRGAQPGAKRELARCSQPAGLGGEGRCFPAAQLEFKETDASPLWGSLSWRGSRQNAHCFCAS